MTTLLEFMQPQQQYRDNLHELLGIRFPYSRLFKLGLLVMLTLGSASGWTPAISQDWKSGQDSPVHDSDRQYPVSGKQLVLENPSLRISFDQRTGAIIEL